MLRRDGIEALLRRVDNEPIIANLGSATFDLYGAGDRDGNFYTFGAMGLVSSVGLGVALASPDRKVFVTDGDGSLLMNLGSLATIAWQAPANLVHITWDNGMWYETGGQPTHTSTGTDLGGVARAAGIRMRRPRRDAGAVRGGARPGHPGGWAVVHPRAGGGASRQDEPSGRRAGREPAAVPPHVHRLTFPAWRIALSPALPRLRGRG